MARYAREEFVYHRAQRYPTVDQQAPELEQRLSELQAQVDRLSLSLHLWRQTQDEIKPTERRLAELTERCAEILDTWMATGDRHAQVVGELENRLTQWNATEARLEHDAAHRIRALGRAIEHEWEALRHIHEEPVKQLREQAASLTEVCIATASTAQSGFDRAEARLSALEAEFHRRMAELAREVRAAVAELRSRNDAQQPWALAEAGAHAWPLEGVMRLHNQLRQPEGVPKPNGSDLQGDRPDEVPAGTIAPRLSQPTALAERVESLERAISDGRIQMQEAADRTEHTSRSWRVVVVVLAVAAAAAGAFAWRVEQRASAAAARAVEAERQTRDAREAADRRIAETRDEAARQVAQARATAVKAQIVSDVLAAPDLVRYNLVGGNVANRFSGQLLWSRSRGLVFSASRLPPPPADTIYQIWLLTAADPVSAAVFTPDGSGRATFATDDPPRVSRPVLGASVTVERVGGSHAPSGQTILTRLTVLAADHP
jgi:hypothetical protein